MWKHKFLLIRVFLCKDRIVDSIPIRESTGQRKPVFSHILRSEGFGYLSSYEAKKCKVLRFLENINWSGDLKKSCTTKFGNCL